MKIPKKYIVGIFVIIILWIIIIIIQPSDIEDPLDDDIDHSLIEDVLEDEDIHEEEHLEAWEPLTDIEIMKIETLRRGPLANIENEIPEGSLYSIEYGKDIVGDPYFNIIVDATTWEEHSNIEQEALNLFREQGVEPCQFPFYDTLIVTIKNPEAFDYDSPDPEEPLCSQVY